MNFKSKKGWLDYLYYRINKQRDFALCGLFKLPDKEVRAAKWTSYHRAIFPVDYNEDWKLKNINQRQILPSEVVLDIETKEGINETIQKLKERHIEHYVYDTGSRGVHISIFFDRDLNREEKERIIKTFGGDLQKSANITMIALEFTEHWKSGKKKEFYNGNSN